VRPIPSSKHPASHGLEAAVRVPAFPADQSHPHAEPRGDAEAAGEHGKFWGMHDPLFEHQDALENDQLIAYATTLASIQSGRRGA